MKKSSLTVGGIMILSTGLALATETGATKPTGYFLTVMIWLDHDEDILDPVTKEVIDQKTAYTMDVENAPFLEGDTYPATKPHPGIDQQNGKLRLQDEYLEDKINPEVSGNEGECKEEKPPTACTDGKSIPSKWEISNSTHEEVVLRDGTTNNYRKGWLVTIEVTVTEWK